ncbi:MAG: excinuclease ABC subunit UvrC, partial [Bacillota bacterium]|nr:excinuclease ABC subunit UvrC [Bacillota bacterium]
QDKLLRELEARMQEAAENLEFEKAARLRDQFRAVLAVTEKQKIVATEGGDRDVIAMAAAEDLGCAQLFAVRGGKLTGREHFLLTNPTGEGQPEMLAAFLRRFYSVAGDVPPEILLSADVPEKDLLEEWLGSRKGGRVRLRTPQRGQKKELVRLAKDNAAMFLEQEILREKARNPKAALQALAETLGLESPPFRIEGYDISHLYGEGTVASMVIFENGLPLPADYRRFRIRSVDKPDDYASMKEVLTRRFARLLTARQEGNLTEDTHDPFLLAPDLILIDGGLGQLNAALQALDALQVHGLAVISLAKEEELIHQPGRREPLRLPRQAPALQLLQRVRDEAHRFAVTQQRKQRSAAGRGSFLLDVPGIGDKRRKALLKHFGSIAAMRRATPDELASVAGMNAATAAVLYEYLRDGPAGE